MWTDDVARAVLPNGLTLLVERNDSAPVVSVVTHVCAGYFDEPDEWVGISHVLEHMFFKRADLKDEIQRLGGYLNAGTIYEKTVYYTVLPSAPGTIDAALQLQAQALTQLTVDANELAKELEVIVQEANRKKDNPLAVVGETLYAKLFSQHRIRRWRIGTEEELRRLKRADVTSYYETRYTPDRTIVALVGDFDQEATLDAARRAFEHWRRDSSEFAPSPPETNPPPPSFEILRGDVGRGLGALGWRTRGGLHDDVAALDAAAAVLGVGRSSWLGRAVRQKGLASSASASHYTPADVGVFSLFLEGNPNRLDDAIERSLQLIGGMAASGVDRDDLACVKALLRSRWAQRMETVDGRAMMFAEFESLGGYHLLDEWYGTIEAVTRDDVTGAVRSYLSPEQASAVMYTTADAKTRYGKTHWPGSIAARPPAAAPIPAGSRAHGIAARWQGTEHADGTRAVELPGADLLFRSKRGSGLAFVGLYADSLRANERAGQEGITSLMLRASIRGAGQWTADDLARLAESLGGSVVPMIVSGWAGWGVTVEQRSLGAAAALLMHIARSATLETSLVEIERSLLASDAARALDDMSGYPIQRVIQNGLPSAWYGKPVLGDPDGVSAIAPGRVEEWAEELRRRRLTVVVVGDAPVEELMRQATVFQEWPPAERIAHPSEPFAWTAARDSEPRDKQQTALAMAFPARPYGSVDHQPAIVAAAMLSGLTGRLFRDLRDRHALAYSVSASPWFRSRAGGLLTYIATSPDREEDARSQMLETLRVFAADGFREDEFERARNYVAGRLQLRSQSAHAIAGDILSAWLHDDLEDLAALPARMREIPGEDVEAAIGRIVAPDSRAEYVVRGGVAS